MRVLSIWFALASLAFLTPANAEIVAVCSASGEPETASYGSAAVLKLVAPKDTKAAASVSQLALWRDGKGFDVLLNWGTPAQLSLRAEGAEIMGNELEADFIHLAVARAGVRNFEHFLFTWDQHALGELIWSAPDDAGGNGRDAISQQMACIKRKT